VPHSSHPPWPGRLPDNPRPGTFFSRRSEVTDFPCHARALVSFGPVTQRSEIYRSSGTLRSWIPVFIVLLSIPPTIWALYKLPNKNSNAIGAAAWGIMLGCALCATIVAIVVSHRLAKAAAQKLAAMLNAEGFTAVLEPTEDQRAATLEGMTPLAMFESAGTLHWFAYRKLDGIKLPAVVLQHSHVVGSGKTTREHFRTLVAWPLAQQSKPEIWMRRPKAGLQA